MSEEPLRGQWYQLVAGAFEPAAGPETTQPVEARPWTVQERVSDLAVLDGRLYLAVNGQGVAAVELPGGSRNSPPRFRYFYDPPLFRYRTLTALIPQADSLLAHLYFNRLLNVTGPESLLLRGVSLLELYPGDGIYRLVSIPFHAAHPEWECVGFAPRSPQSFLLEWKYSGATETRFQYTLFSLRVAVEQPAERGAYRKACQPAPVDKRLPAALQQLIHKVIGSSEEGFATAFHFRVRVSGEPLARLYACYPSGFERAARVRIVTHFVFQGSERWRLLTPKGLLLTAGPSLRGQVESRRLPALPEGFSYTDLFVFDERLAAPWEQSDFTRSGATGIFISGQL